MILWGRRGNIFQISFGTLSKCPVGPTEHSAPSAGPPCAGGRSRTASFIKRLETKTVQTDRQLQKTESRGKSGGHQTHRVTSPFYLELSARPCVVVDVCVVRKTTERWRCRWSHTATHLRRAQHPRRSWKTSPSVFTTMPFSVNGILCTLALLVLWRAEELVEACSCAPVHPQQAFCNADVGESSRGVYSCCCLCCCCLCLPGLSCSEPGSCTAN